MSEPGFVTESDALHARVQAFAQGDSSEDFDALALDIARFQGRYIPAYRRLLDARGSSLGSASDIVAVPTDAFRLARVAVHPESLDQARFISSGTSSAARSQHPIRRLDTYQVTTVRFAKEKLVDDTHARRVVVALAPHPGTPPTSSLGFMMRALMVALDGRALSVDPDGALFNPDNLERWLVSNQGLNLSGLERAARIALERQEPLLLLATSLALVNLLEVLEGRILRCPRSTVVMQTGGTKGRTLRATAPEIAAGVARAFGIGADRVVSEYGMTELCSQAYSDVLRLGEGSDVYVPAPCLRITPVDPVRLRPLADGQPGLARFVDLCNVDSAVAVLTQDLVQTCDGGVQLLGRRPGAPARGCSLDLEDLILYRNVQGAG